MNTEPNHTEAGSVIAKGEHNGSSRVKANRLSRPAHRAPYGLTPFAQGELDGLCGLYAVINALRLLVRPGDGITEAFWGALFGRLLIRADRAYGIDHLVRFGTPQWLSRVLSRYAARQVTATTGVMVSVGSLAERGYPTHSISTPIALGEALANGHVSAIILLQGYHDHWTVLRQLTAASLWLFDSDGLASLRFKDIDWQRRLTRRRHFVPRRGITLLQRRQ